MKRVRLGDVVDIKGGGTPDKSIPEYWGGTIPWASVKDFKSTEIDTTTDSITQLGVANSSTNIIPAGTIIIPTRMAVGKAAINSIDLAINQDLKALFPKSDIFTRYLLNFLLASSTKLEKQAFGATVKGITLDILKNLEIPLPPIEEQRRIAEILDRTQSLISKRKEAIALLDTLTQSIFLEMFGDPVTNPFKFPFLPLENVVSSSFQNGAYFPKEAYCSEGGVEMIHMSDAFEGIVKRGNLKHVDCPQKDIERYKLLNTDLIVARRSLNYEGSVKPCLIPFSTEPLIFESSLIRITPNPEKTIVIYLFYYILNPRVREQFIFPFVTKSTISGINQENLAKVLVMIPPINLQKEFAQRVEAVEKLKATHQASLSELQALFASLQHRAFRGEL
jgi:type I restriction enzyme S subunit